MSCCDFYKNKNFIQKLIYNFKAMCLIFKLKYGKSEEDDGTTGALSKKKRKQLYERRLKMEDAKRKPNEAKTS